MKKTLHDVWEAPQNALGYAMSRLWKKRLVAFDSTTPEGMRELEYIYGLEELVGAITGIEVKVYVSDYYRHKDDPMLGPISGFSMGKYICLNSAHDIETLKHEIGHLLQSAKWGWLYLPVVGIQSAVFCNLWQRWFHKGWNSYDRHYWYYVVKHWFEGDADEKGKVRRKEKLRRIPRPSGARYPAMENHRVG